MPTICLTELPRSRIESPEVGLDAFPAYCSKTSCTTHSIAFDQYGSLEVSPHTCPKQRFGSCQERSPWHR
ncbi:hypothetical protein PM082_000517 [Marasmius tenuissimus]|nr:hypothetical protein PM082_000517 [Marasmius tenuissimus]